MPDCIPQSHEWQSSDPLSFSHDPPSFINSNSKYISLKMISQLQNCSLIDTMTSSTMGWRASRWFTTTREVLGHHHSWPRHILWWYGYIALARPEVGGSTERLRSVGDEDMTSMHMAKHSEWHEDEGDLQGFQNRVAGPKLIRFESPRWRPKTTQVRVHLGVQEQLAQKMTPRSYTESVLDVLYMAGKIISRSF